MKAESIAPVLEGWEGALEGSPEGSPEGSLEAIVWDGAKGHQGSTKERSTTRSKPVA